MMYLGKDPVGLATSIPEFQNIAKIEVGQYTPSMDEQVISKQFQHSLGEIPDFICYYCNTFPVLDSGEKAYLISGVCYCTDVKSASASGIRMCMYGDTTTSQLKVSNGLRSPSFYATDNYFILPYVLDSHYLLSEMTYNYIIGKFKEVTSNANE